MRAKSELAQPATQESRDAEEAIRRLMFDYAAALDEQEFDTWPEFFVDDCLYKIISAENVRRNLPMPIMYCNSKGMLRDRILALKEITVYNKTHAVRHLISNIRVDRTESDLRARANFTLFQTTPDGASSLFLVGRYEDQVVEVASGLRFKEKIVIIDTFSVPNLIAVPL